MENTIQLINGKWENVYNRINLNKLKQHIPYNFDNRGFGEYIGKNINDTMTQYEFFTYYFTPTEYIDVENLVDVDTIRI